MGDLAFRHRCLRFGYSHTGIGHSGFTFIHIGLTLRDRGVHKNIYRLTYRHRWYTDKKENLIFLIYREIQNGAVAKSYMTNGLLIYWEIFAHFLIY
jgi:hypothetical protein